MGYFQTAFVYIDGAMLDLNTMLDPITGAGWQLSVAHDINDKGQIVASAYKEGVGNRGLLLTPILAVPEPSAGSLVAIAFGVLLAFRCRQTRSGRAEGRGQKDSRHF
jgi:uncharacterized membrane protein